MHEGETGGKRGLKKLNLNVVIRNRSGFLSSRLSLWHSQTHAEGSILPRRSQLRTYYTPSLFSTEKVKIPSHASVGKRYKETHPGWNWKPVVLEEVLSMNVKYKWSSDICFLFCCISLPLFIFAYFFRSGFQRTHTCSMCQHFCNEYKVLINIFIYNILFSTMILEKGRESCRPLAFKLWCVEAFSGHVWHKVSF